MPKSWTRLLNGYSRNANEGESSETTNLWKSIIGRYVTRLIIYSVVITALIVLCRSYLMPLILKLLGDNAWGHLTSVAATLLIVGPFIASIILPTVKRSEQEQLVETSGNVSYVPIVIMTIISVIVSTVFITSILHGVYSGTVSMMFAVLITVLTLVFISTVPTPLRRRVTNIEKRFINNINERENRRTGHEHNLVSDLHLAYMRVGHDCSFIGDQLRDLDLRTRYGVNLADIQRGSKHHPVPSGDMRIFPGDVLGVIGTEEQIQRLLPLVEADNGKDDVPNYDVKFVHFAISAQSPVVGKSLENAGLREDYGALLVSVQRGDEYISPTPSLVFRADDILWIVGDPKQLQELKG